MLAAPPVPSNGWGRYAQDLVAALAAQGHQIVMITARNAPDRAKVALPLEGYHRLLPSVVPLARALWLRTLLLRPAVGRLCADCDLIHVEAEPYMLAADPSKRRVVTAHGTYLPNLVKQSIAKGLYHRAFLDSTVICVSDYTRRRVQAVLREAKMVVVPNGVDWQRFAQAGTPQPKRGPTVLAVGALKVRKGYDILVRAMPTVRKEIPDARLVCIGSGQESDYARQIQELIEQNGGASYVQFLGRVSEDALLGWYHTADLFALPVVTTDDQFEGFGLVYLEANAAGLPAIGTWDSGAEGAIVDGETGLLVQQRSAPAAAEAIIKLLKDSALRQRMGQNGLAHARQYSWDKTASAVAEVYKGA
jgi:phosphatidylinositol alpha-1,6-mannosyltransferase